MGREVRKVPGNWKHPKRPDGSYEPLHDFSYAERKKEYEENQALWNEEKHPDQLKGYAKDCESFEEWEGDPPDPDDYMPDWPDEERTHYQMYENVSEGTPLSPPMETPEDLARWLVDNNANAFAGSTATYEQWLAVCKGGYAPTMVCKDGVMMGGVHYAERGGSNEKEKNQR